MPAASDTGPLPPSPPLPPNRRVAVVGAGWAGLAAAVRAAQRGAQVTVFEMAHTPGGRARSLRTPAGQRFDNGQHILIGAYTATLDLMRTVGADPDALLWRGPLALVRPDGRGLALPPGAPVPAFVRAVVALASWTWADRLKLLTQAARWRLSAFQCPSDWTVDRLCRSLPRAVRSALIDPLCVAALNTPAGQASAQVFLRVLRDALFAGPGSADLLLPRAPLSALLPDPAQAWLQAADHTWRSGKRVQQISRTNEAWLVDGEPFDQVVVATPAAEAARLVAPMDSDWARQARALVPLPIVTVWLRDPQLRLPHPMVSLAPPESGVPSDINAPAQFAFDLRPLGQPAAGFAFVASAADSLLSAGVADAATRVLNQARRQFPGAFVGAGALLHVAAERRATFACTAGLQRPPGATAGGLLVAGDHVHGPYPATLEGAVRAGLAAADRLT